MVLAFLCCRSKLLLELIGTPFKMTKLLGDGEQPTLPWALDFWDQALREAKGLKLTQRWADLGLTQEDLDFVFKEACLCARARACETHATHQCARHRRTSAHTQPGCLPNGPCVLQTLQRFINGYSPLMGVGYLFNTQLY